MDLGTKSAKTNDKTSLEANLTRKYPKRVDVAQNLAPGRPNNDAKRAPMTVIWGGPGPCDGHRRGSTKKETHVKFILISSWHVVASRCLSCVDVARFLISRKIAVSFSTFQKCDDVEFRDRKRDAQAWLSCVDVVQK